jgi:acetyltransferase
MRISTPPARLPPELSPRASGVVIIRRVRTRDVEGLERLYASLSPDSRHSRFFAMTSGLSRPTAVTFCTPDHHHREGFVAELSGPDVESMLVGHLCLEPVSADTAEVAIAVADDYQHRGIGSRLMTAGVAWARAEGIRRLTATTYSTNVPLLRLLRHLGATVTVDVRDAAFTELTIAIGPPTAAAA